MLATVSFACMCVYVLKLTQGAHAQKKNTNTIKHFN